MATAATPAAPARHDGELSHQQILTIILGLMAGMFLAALDQNVVGTAIKTIADDLHGLDQQVWVTTAYLITSTISTPIYGKLSDIYGRKTFYLAAITIFIIGSALCAFAGSMYQLAGFRAVQGLGAGGLMSLALAIIGDIVPPRERAKYQGYFLAVFGTSAVLGPVLGGFFSERSDILGLKGWQWIFFMNVPIGLIAFAAVTATLHLHHVPRKARIDWAGATTIVVGLVPLLLVAEQGRTWGWTSPSSLLCFGIGLIGLAAFVWSEARAGDDALIPLRIFRNRTIVIALSGGFVIGAGMFGGMMTIPLYLQIVHGSRPMESGLQMLPMVVGMMISSIVSGQLMTRTGKVRIYPIIGVALMTIVLFLLSRIGADTSLSLVMVYMFFFGLGLGLTMQPLTLAVQAAVSSCEIGMATSSATFFRQIGGTLGVAIFLSVLFNSLQDKIGAAFTAAATDPSFVKALRDPAVAGYSPESASFVKAMAAGRGGGALGDVGSDSSVIGTLHPTLSHPIKVGFSQSMDTVFLLGSVVCALGVVVLLFLPDMTLSNRSAMATAADERARSLDPLPEDASDEDRELHAGLQKFLLDAAAAETGGHTLEEIPSRQWQEDTAGSARRS
ncbi:MDR family MFS transporter [Arsenicicoccus dermatophilus]|uniref:MDR family MFS transporter n=1 Tax=Arsenicicoccus dermatophilus TaxID=1076331 RepID=UPI003916D3CF